MAMLGVLVWLGVLSFWTVRKEYQKGRQGSDEMEKEVRVPVGDLPDQAKEFGLSTVATRSHSELPCGVQE